MQSSEKLVPVNTALCSFGMSGKIFHAPFLKVNPLFHLSAVWERTKELSREMFPDIKIYRSLEELLADKDIELIIVNTPNRTHFEYAKKALNAGKHVVVEKPFTITAKEGLQLKKLAEEKHLVLTVYHNRRFDSDYKVIREILKSKKLGKVLESEMHFDRYRPEPGKKKHKEQPGAGTGNLYDLGSHLLDQAIQLFGMPDELFAVMDIIRKKSKVDDFFDVILFYQNHLKVRVHGSYLSPDFLPGYIFYGEKGAFFKYKTNVQEEILSKGILPGSKNWGAEPSQQNGTLITYEGKTSSVTRIPSPNGNYGEFYNLLFDAIRKNKPVPVSATDAIRVVHLIECAFHSNRLKRTIKVPSLI